MRRTQSIFIPLLLLLAAAAHAQLPANFSWINIESDQKVMPLVRRALHDNTITAIREVGVEDGYALVMTASREADAPTPDYDQWTIYNVALNSGKSRVLVGGYGVNVTGWLGPAHDELGITYYNCWECEAATLFTTLHFVKGKGWRARWENQLKIQDFPHPGALYKDDGADMDVEEDVAFAILDSPNGSFVAANWIHTRDPSTNKIEDDITRYSIDPSTGADRVESLQGPAAVSIERAICSARRAYFQPMSGQDSKLCRALLKTPAAPPKAPK